MKRIIVFSFSFFLLCLVSISRSDDTAGPIVVKGPGDAPGTVKTVIAQAGQPQQQTELVPVPQQTQSQALPQAQMQPFPQQAQPQTTSPQTTPPQAQRTQVPTRIQRVEQVREQQERLRQQAAQGGIIPQAETTGTNGVSTQPQTSSVAGRTSARASGMISLNFDDADVYSVAQTVFGEILRVNYIIDQRVKGRVTFRSIAPVNADQVLPLMEVIFRLNGIGVVEENNLYRIVPIGDVAKEPAQVSIGREPDKITLQGKSIIQVVPISYSSSSDMIKLVTPFLTASAIVIDVPTMNHIILVDTDANVRRILSLINLFDSEETKAKKPQINVYHVQNSTAKDIATILQQAFAATTVVMPVSTTTVTTSTSTMTTPGSAVPQPGRLPTQSGGTQSGTSSAAGAGGSLISPMTKIIADENLNLLVVLALPEDYEMIKEAIKKVDIIPRQVVIEGLVAEVNLVDDLSLGISWALQLRRSGMGGVEGLVGFNMPGASVSNPPSITDVEKGKFSFAGTVGADFRAVINTLATQSKAKLLAAPRILVSDNKEASINVGEQVPIVTSSTSTPSSAGSGNTITSTIQYKDVGIILKVKPRINEGGLVSLELTQEISSYSLKDVSASGTTTEQGIVVSKTEAKTNLVVQNGNTIMIGGLIREDLSDGQSGIPLLSKIPVLGYLFGKTDKTNHRKELIILLTPHVVTNQAEAKAVTSGYVDTIAETGKGKIKREELIREQKPKAPDNGTSK